ncbi:hypothetical protein [Micromonospora sp. NPDC047527]|uniref:hypothetical protein n=1 Tax=Micromonospora sp. NPDC047527 TaxID=3155144 RepID=UPI0033C4D4A3
MQVVYPASLDDYDCVQSAMWMPGYFAEPAIAVVPTVTRAAIEATVALMAQRDLADVV